MAELCDKAPDDRAGGVLAGRSRAGDAADRASGGLNALPVLMLGALALLMSGIFLLQFRGPSHDRADMPGSGQHALPGVTLVDAEPAGHGVVITSIQSSSAAARRDLKVGDDIVAIDGEPVHTLDQASRYLIEAPQRTVVVALVRDDEMRWVTLERPGN